MMLLKLSLLQQQCNTCGVNYIGKVLTRKLVAHNPGYIVYNIYANISSLSSVKVVKLEK